MCYNCYIEDGSPQIVNERTIKGAKLIDEIYEQHNCGSGGYAHIVVDDWNIDDESIDCCLNKRNIELFSDISMYSRNVIDTCLRYLKELSYDERVSSMAIHSGILKIK